eukprot:TCONS_00042270-protein
MAEPGYFNDDLDEVLISFIPDELVKSIKNGTDQNLNLVHTGICDKINDATKKIPNIVLKLSADDVQEKSEKLWKSALSCLQDDRSFFIGDQCTIQKRKCTLNNLIANLSVFQEQFKTILLKIYEMVELCLPTTPLISEGRRLMWQKFYTYISSEQCTIDWIPLRQISTVANFDLIVYKLSSKLLELLITENIESYLSLHEESTTSIPMGEKMDDREQNIVKYVAGFIAHSATKYYKKREEGEKFVDAIKTWSIKTREAKCFEFKDKWVDLQNRGGLVDVNDNCFLFFRTVEYSVRDVFNPVTLNNYAGENLKKVIQEKIYKRKYLIYRWDELMKGDNLESFEKENLFKLVIARWIDIRGKAFVRAWVDGLRSQYKDKVSEKGEHSHRKQLNAKKSTKSKSKSSK